MLPHISLLLLSLIFSHLPSNLSILSFFSIPFFSLVIFSLRHVWVIRILYNTLAACNFLHFIFLTFHSISRQKSPLRFLLFWSQYGCPISAKWPEDESQTTNNLLSLSCVSVSLLRMHDVVVIKYFQEEFAYYIIPCDIKKPYRPFYCVLDDRGYRDWRVNCLLLTEVNRLSLCMKASLNLACFLFTKGIYFCFII